MYPLPISVYEVNKEKNLTVVGRFLDLEIAKDYVISWFKKGRILILDDPEQGLKFPDSTPSYFKEQVAMPKGR